MLQTKLLDEQDIELLRKGNGAYNEDGDWVPAAETSSIIQCIVQPYREGAKQFILPEGIKSEDIPVVAFSVGEEELSGIDTKPLVGHLAAWNYFESIDAPANKDFIKTWKTYIKDEKRVTNDPMEATYIGFNLWVKAVEKAGYRTGLHYHRH